MCVLCIYAEIFFISLMCIVFASKIILKSSRSTIKILGTLWHFIWFHRLVFQIACEASEVFRLYCISNGINSLQDLPNPTLTSVDCACEFSQLPIKNSLSEIHFHQPVRFCGIHGDIAQFVEIERPSSQFTPVDYLLSPRDMRID